MDPVKRITRIRIEVDEMNIVKSKSHLKVLCLEDQLLDVELVRGIFEESFNPDLVKSCFKRPKVYL